MLTSCGAGNGVDGRTLGWFCLEEDFEFFRGRPRFSFLGLDPPEEGRTTGFLPSPRPTVEPTVEGGTGCFLGSFCATTGRGRGVVDPLGAGRLPGEGLVSDPKPGTLASIAPIVGRGSWPSRMSLRSLRSQASVWGKLYHCACCHLENKGAG